MSLKVGIIMSLNNNAVVRHLSDMNILHRKQRDSGFSPTVYKLHVPLYVYASVYQSCFLQTVFLSACSSLWYFNM